MLIGDLCHGSGGSRPEQRRKVVPPVQLSVVDLCGRRHIEWIFQVRLATGHNHEPVLEEYDWGVESGGLHRLKLGHNCVPIDFVS